MSFTRRILDGVNSLLEKVAADDTPLSGVTGEALQAELEARAAAHEKGGGRAPDENPIAKIAGAGKASRRKRAELADERERRVRGERKKREASARRSQEEAFRRMKEQARQQPPPRAGRRAAGGASGRAGGRRTGFGGLRTSDEVAKAYRVLNLPKGAPFDQVRTAYRQLMRRYHPDLHNRSPKKQKAATELSVQVTQAYNVLDRHLRGGK